jgi:hypothetical protein
VDIVSIAAETSDRWFAVLLLSGGKVGFAFASCRCSECCEVISVVTLNQRRTRVLFDGHTALNVGIVAASTRKMTITIDGIACDTTKQARAWLGSDGVACNFHDHRGAGIAQHARFWLADASA